MQSNEFKITCSITKSFEKMVDGRLRRYIKGIASGTSLDLEDERMVRSVIDSFKKAIIEGIFLPDGQFSYIPLRSGHEDEWEYIIGYLVDAEIDDDYNLWITAELEDGNPKADLLYRRLTVPPEIGKPVKLGLSVGGLVVSAGHEWDSVLNKFIRVFYEVMLREVSVVSQPAYPTQYLYALSKSVDWNAVRGKTQLVDDMVLLRGEPINDKEKFMEDENVTHAEEQTAPPEQMEKADHTVAVEAESVEKNEELVEEPTQEVAEVTKSESEETAPVEATNEPVVEKAEASSQENEVFSLLSKQLTDLTDTVSGLMAKVQDLEKSRVEQVITESETTTKSEAVSEEPTEVVSKAESTPAALSLTDLASVMKSALEDALKPLEDRLTRIEEEPVDKSLAVTPAKTGADDSTDYISLFEAQAQGLSGTEALTLALQMAQRQN